MKRTIAIEQDSSVFDLKIKTIFKNRTKIVQICHVILDVEIPTGYIYSHVDFLGHKNIKVRFFFFSSFN